MKVTKKTERTSKTEQSTKTFKVIGSGDQKRIIECENGQERNEKEVDHPAAGAAAPTEAAEDEPIKDPHDEVSTTSHKKDEDPSKTVDPSKTTKKCGKCCAKCVLS